ncbi:protein unc-13 homolog C-like [Saccostrea cucullata]|uniref:protein unc-13 homolog C-like n=1 Tax=Saccostrea cuccullata TaxID=36930 RepID=UPI002ED35770
MNFGSPSPSKPPKKKKQKKLAQGKMAASQKSQNKLEDDILIERAHRIGRRNNVKPRPIVAKFNRFPQRELIRKNAFKLKGTHLSIGEQFPKEIQERRKGLYPIYKKAKEDEKKASLVKDKLYIDGELYIDAGSETPEYEYPKSEGGARGFRRGGRGGRGK